MADVDYEKELAQFGVKADLEDESGSDSGGEEHAETPKGEETPKEEETPREEPEKEIPEKSTLQTNEEKPRKRSIYEDYKEKKQELKSERELREQAERERDELKQRLEALDSADTPKEKQEAKDELEAYAEKIGADPEALRGLRSIFLKDIPKPEVGIDEETKKSLQEFNVWKQQNSQVMEKQLFEEEFTKTIPTIKQLFPSANDTELSEIKKAVDTLSHTQGYHDKELDYVVFKEQEVLKNLVSPKKRGMESPGRIQTDGATENDFDMNAEPADMNPEQRAKWMTEYDKVSKSMKGVVTDSKNRKILL